MRKLLLTTLLAILTLVTGAQESQLEKPLLTLACISDVHTERSLIRPDGKSAQPSSLARLDFEVKYN